MGNDTEILQQLSQAPPAASTQADMDTAATSSAGNAANQLVKIATSPSDLSLAQSIDRSRPQGVWPTPETPQAPNLNSAAPGSSTYAPGSFADKFAGALSNAKKALTPEALQQPGAIHKAIVGTWLDALSNTGATKPTSAPVQPARRSPVDGILAQLGDVGAASGPGGVAGGFARAAAAGAQRGREADKDRAVLAESNARMLHEQALTHKLGEEQIQAAVSSGKAGADALLNAEKPATVVAEGKTSDELKTMIDKGELDPTRQTVFLTGRIQAGTDANGQPLFRSTYSVLNPAGEVKLDEKQAKYLNDNLHSDWQKGQALDAVQFNHQWQQAQNHEASDAARKLALSKIGEQVDKAKLDSEANNIGNDKQIQAALTAAQSGPNDPHSLVKAYNALINNKEFMASHPNFTQTYPRWAGGGDAKKFETMQENYAKAQDKSQNAVDDMLNKAQTDPKEIEGHTPAYTAAMKAIIADPSAPPEKKKKAAEVLAVVQDVRQGEIDFEKAKAEGKKEASVGFQGDDSATTPQAFLASLKPAEQATVKMIGEGRAGDLNLAYLGSRKPEILDAVARAYPDFDKTKVTKYVETSKDFSSKKIANQILSGGAVLQHLQEARELNTNASHIPGTPAYNAYKSKINTLGDELGQFYGASTIPGIAGFEDTLMSTLPGTREAAILTQAQSMTDRLTGLVTRWRDSAPSKEYEAKMPWISPEGQYGLSKLSPQFAQDYPELVQQGAQTPKAKREQATNAPTQFQGKIGVEAGGKTHYFNSQAEADNFKKLAGIH